MFAEKLIAVCKVNHCWLGEVLCWATGVPRILEVVNKPRGSATLERLPDTAQYSKLYRISLGNQSCADCYRELQSLFV